MEDMQTRTLELSRDKRTTLRFDRPTWKAIELLAARAGVRWTKWVRDVMEQHPNSANMHATVRAIAMDALLGQQLLAERAEHSSAYVPPLMLAAGTLDDDQLREELSQAFIEYGPVECGGFSVRSGADAHNRACVWIENMVKGWPHYAIPLPFTLGEIGRKVNAS